MPDYNKNISAVYSALQQQNFSNLGTEQEFAKRMQNKDNRKAVYDAMSSMNFSNLGSYDEFEARFASGGAPTEQKPAPTIDEVKGRKTFNISRNPVLDEEFRAATQPAPAPQEQRPAEPAPAPAPVAEQPEVNPFPYSGGLEEEQQDIARLREEVAGDAAFVEEYEKRQAADRKRNQMVSGVNPLAGAANRGADARWLKENEARYKEAKSNVARVEKAATETENAIAAAEMDSARRRNREEMASPQEIIATGKTPFGRDNAGRTDSEYRLRKAADELYASADKEYDKSSKYQEGYSGGFMDQLATAVKDFGADALNNIDSGSLTFGGSKGLAMKEAREVGDKYNSLIDGVLKDMKMTEGDVVGVLTSLETTGPKLEALSEELEAASAEIDTMTGTYEDMTRRGDPDAEAYGRQLQKKIDAYNKRVNDEYKPAREVYDRDLETYNAVTSGIDAAIETGLTGGEKALLDAMEKFTEAKTLRSDDVSTAGKAGAGTEQSAEFMLDFILTGGIAKGGAKAATKLATKRALKKYGAGYLTDLARLGKSVEPGLGLRLATDAATSGIRTAVMVPRNLQAYGENLTEYSGKDAVGRIEFDRSQANALANSLLTQYIEYWSEGFGEYFGEAEQALFRSVTKNAPKQAIGNTLKGYRGSIGQYLDRGKFDGMFNEMLEEVVGSTFNALAGWMSGDRIGDAGAMKEFFAGENLATLALSFLPMSAIGAATNVSAYHKMKERYDRGAAEMNKFVRAGAISMEELQQLSKDIPNLSPTEVKDKIVDITDRARKSNGGRLPSDFTQNLLGYLEGEFAMGLRYDEWEDSQEKMSVVNSYTDNYSNPDPRSAWDLNDAEGRAKQEALEAGFSEEELDDSDAYILAQDAFEMRGTQPERADVLMRYADAKAGVEGLRRGYAEQGQQIADAYADDVRSNVDHDGAVTTATITLNGTATPVFIVQEDAGVDAANGTLTTPTGPDGTVKYILNEQDKTVRTAKASQFSEAQQQQNTDEFIAEKLGAFQQRRAEFFDRAQNTVSPAGQAREMSQRVGQSVVVTDNNGVYQPFTVERMTRGGTHVVLSGDKKALQGIAEAMGMRVPTSGYLETPVASLYPLLAKEADGTLTTGLGEESQTESVTPAQRPAPAAEQGSELGDLRDRTVPISVNGQAVNAHVINVADGRVTYEETDADGNVTRTASLPELDFSRAMAEAEAPTVEAAEAETPAEEPAQAPVSTIPVDERTGEKVYDAPGVSVEDAIADLYATEGLTEADVDQYIADQAAKAEAARNPERGDMSPQAWGQAKQEAARVADFWSAMQRAAEQRKAQQEEAIEEAVEEATPAATEGAPAAQPATEAQQRVAPAATPMAVDSRRKVVTRLKNWSRRTGVKISIRRSVDEVQDETAKKALQEGRAVTGWYNDKTGEVEVFLPNVMNAVEADKTFIHETVAHKGLRGLLGEDGYNELCDRVWNELMTPEEQAEFMEYNRHLQGSEESLRRAAADEYIARLSENLDMPDNRNVFERIVDWIMDLLGLGGDVSAIEEGAAERAAGAGSITRSDLYDLLEDSLKRFEKGRKKVSDVLQDENGDVRFSEATYMPFKDEFGNEHEGTRQQLINYMVGQGFPQKQIDDFVQHMDYWYDFTQNIANLVNPDGTFKYQAFHDWSETIPGYKMYEGKIVKAISTLVTNGEYPLNFELSTDCIKREAFTQIINEMLKMDASFWKKLTPANIIEIQNLEKAFGIEVACPLCFVEAKRLNILSWATGVADKWNTALKAVAPGVKHTPFGFYKDGDMTVDQVERKNGEVIITQKVKQEIDTINSFLGDAKNLRDKDAKRLRDNAKEMEKVLNGWIKAYAEEHGDIAGFTLTKKQEAQLEKIRNRNMKSATGRMMRIIATHPEVRHTLSPMDLLGSTGLMRIQSMEGEGFAEMLSAIVSANGTGTPKIVQSAVPYDGEIIDVSQARFEKAAGIGGARLFSFSDADLTKIFDIMQIMWDCAARQAKVQSYSKEVPYIVLFGTSGVKINMSMLPEARPGEETERQYRAATQAGKQRIKHDVEEYVGLQVDQDGNIVGLDLSDSHSITDEFARWIFHNPEYNANCGAIMVGIGVNHAIYCMMQPHIRMLIPFHLSGMPLAAREKGDVFWYHDFTNEQNTGVMVDGVRVKLMGKNGSIVPSVKEEFNIYEGEEKEDWDIRERCREYIKWCDENGLLPKFPWAVNAEGYANWMREHGYEPRQDFIDAMNAHTTDGVWDEYYKVITDFTAYQPEFDEAGNMIGEKSARHLPVTGRINTDPELLKTVFGTNAEGNEVISEESMLSNRERSIQNADKHAREIAALAIDMLNSGKKASDMVDMSGSQFNNKADSELFLQERELPMPEGMKDVEGESPADVDVTEGGVTMFRERTAPAPKNTKTGYAAFAVLPDGKGGYALYPKMVQAEGGQGTPVLTWLDAETGEIRRDENGDIITNTLGRIQVQDSSIDKKGKANKGQGLAWRPGKHLAEYPNATQFAVKNPKTGEKDVMQDNIIFFEVSFAADKDYQTEAWEYGFNKNGKYNHSQAGLPYIPVDGYYKYRTNVNPDIPAMIITGSYKIEKALTDAQAKEINQKLGGTWLERESGKPVDEARLRELGLAEDQLAARRDAYDFSAIQKGRNESAQVMTLEGYTPRAINFDDKNLMAAARENGQDLDAYREGYQSPEERGWNREGYTSGTRFREANRNQLGFVSNAEASLDRIKMDKATPEQWAKMIEKEGGMKAGEDKWLGLSDWLKGLDRKTVTKDEIADYIAEHRIQIEEVNYTDLDDDAALAQLQEEFNTIPFDSPEAMWEEADRRVAEFYSEMEEKYGDDYLNEMTQSERVAEENLLDERERWSAENAPSDYESAFHAMVEKYGDDFETAFGVSMFGSLYIENEEAAEKFLGARSSNKVRLDYTTEGLDNKREIALVVPTIESWNERDKIHFGDAGNGRAVAWARFGETTDEQGNKVLVIDEIQSKRHQEGRERGYKSDENVEELEQKWRDASKAYDDYIDSLKEKYGGYNGMAGHITEEENQKAVELNDASIDAANAVDKARGGIPAAPFEKNWHELAMKRMLRLAAEEGYDYVAWTTGDQQAERYNIGKAVRSVFAGIDQNGERHLMIYPDGGGAITVTHDENGSVSDIRGDQSGALADAKNISDIVGKDIAAQALTVSEPGTANGKEFKGDGLRVGGEGMKGFYDDILPRFMNKYGKKWGVKVSDINLPNVEQAAQTMHAVPVTQEMKESVMQGQTMFREADAAAREEARQSERRDELAHNWTANAGLRLAKRDIENGVQLSRQNPGLTLRLGLPSGALLAAGIRDQQIVMSEYDLVEDSANGYGDKHSYHPFDLDDLKDLASLINHPIAVFRDPNNPYARILLLDKKGYNLSKKESGKHDYIAIIKSVPVVDKRGHYVMDSNGRRTYENRISTIYPEDRSWRNLYNQLRNNSSDVTWVDNKKISFWVKGHSSNVRAYDAITQKDIANIQKRFENKQDLLRDEAKNLRADGSTLFRERITPEQDKEYMDAVNSGDMEKAQRMVRDAAKAAGYNSPKLYHGSDAFGFTSIRADAADDGISFWATNKEKVAGSYTKLAITRKPGTEINDADYDRAVSEAYDALDDGIRKFRYLIDKHFSEWFFGQQGNEGIRKVIMDANHERGYGDGVYDVLEDYVAEAYGGYGEGFEDEYEDFADWEENSPEAHEILEEINSLEGLRDQIWQLENGELSGGIYELYSNTDNMFVVDAKGKAWNELHPEGLPKIVRGQYKDVPYRTRDVVKWAKENGYDGVIFKNVRDNGRYGRTEPSDVFAFLNPQTQVKSADPVTYDDNGGVVPLSERFNPENNDIRFREAPVDARSAQVGYEEEIQKATTAWLLEWQDQDIPVRIAINQVMNEVGMKDIPEDADYLTRHNLVSSRADAQMHNYKLFYFEPMMDTIGRIEDILVGGKPTVLDRLTGRREKRLDAYGEIVDYSYAVSGLERNAWKRAEAKANKEKELERLAEKREKESEAINADNRLSTEEKSAALDRAEKRYRKEQDKIEEKYADRDYSGITALMGRPKEEWQEAEADARAMIAEFQQKVNNDDLLNEMWDRIRACTDFNLEHAYKFGLLSRAEYERLHGTESQPRMWEYYLPLRGFSERTAEDEYTYAMFTNDSAGGDIMKKAKGRTTRADDPFAVMRHLSELEIVQGLNNWAKQALYNFVLNAGENTLLTQVEPWYVKEPGTDNWSVAEPNEGESLEDFEARMQEAYEDGDARRGRNGLKLGHIMANKMHRNQHMVRLKINGAEKMIWVNGSPVLAQSVNGVTGWKSRILDGLRTVNRTLSQFYTTYSLNFLTKNMMRDTQFSRIAALVDESQTYLRQLEKNWWANNGYVSFGYPMMKLVAAWESGELEKKQNRTEREQMFIDFMYDGGATGYTMINSMDKIKRELERMVKNAGHGERNIPIIDWYAKGVGALNEASELLTRFTFYQTSRMMGRSRERSAYDAKESSVNFNRRGLRSGVGVSGWTAAAASALYLFMNPAIQGLDKFVRLHKAHPWRMGMVDATYFMMGFVNSLLNAMIAGSSDGDGDDDEKMGPDWYWNIPEWVRRSNMIIGSPFKKLGKWGYLVIALPVEYKGFYAMGELASAIIQGKYAAKDAPTIANEVIGVVSELLPVNPVEGFTPGDNPAMSIVRNMTPGALAPIMDVATNRSFAGIPLWKENIYDEAQPLSQSSFASTPEILNKAVIKLSEATADKPWHVDIPAGAIRGLLKGYGGGAYTFVENTAKFIFADEAHPRRYEQLPFVSGFTGYLDEDRRDTFNSDALQRYKELSDDMVKRIRSAAPGEDIKAKDVYDNPDNLPASARVTRLLHSDEWILGKMYYDGMKKAGDDVKRLRTAWKKAKDEYLELTKDKNATADQLDAAEEKVQQAWLEFTMNEGSLVDRLMEEEYNHARQKVQNGIPYERKETLGEKAYNLTNKK